MIASVFTDGPTGQRLVLAAFAVLVLALTLAARRYRPDDWERGPEEYRALVAATRPEEGR